MTPEREADQRSPSRMASRWKQFQIFRMAKYARFLLRSIFNTFIRPPLVIFILSKTGLLSLPHHRALCVGVYLASVPFSEIILSLRSSNLKKKDCERLGAVSAPKIRGRKLGNVDVLQALIEAEESEYPGDIFLEWAKEYGPTFDMNILWASQIVTLDPENVKYVLSTAFTSFEKSEKFHDMFESFWGEGIFTTDGETWRQHRSNARPFFSLERLSDFSSFEHHLDKVLDILNRMAEEEKAFDLQELFARYTLDTATDFLFGVSAGCLHGFLEQDDEAPYARFMSAFNEVAAVGATRIRIGSIWPLFELTGDKAVAPTKVIDAFVLPIVEKALRPEGSEEDEPSSLNLIEYLSHIMKDKKAVRDECLNMLFAARDTTSSLLTFTAYLLTEHPQVVEKMRAEIDKVCGDRTTLEYNDIKNMKYLEAVLNETLRLFPPVPYNIRRSIGSSALPSPQSKLGKPIYMPPRSSITYAPILIQRDPVYWGDDAMKFRPERWLSNSPPMSHPNAFMAFNLGPRICLGQQLAYIQIPYVWARILRSTSFVRAPDAQPTSSIPPNREWVRRNGDGGRHGVETVWPQPDVVLRVKGGLWVRAHEVAPL